MGVFPKFRKISESNARMPANDKKRAKPFYLNASKRAFRLIEAFEGCRLSEYVCPAGKRTIGVGHCIGKKDPVLVRVLGKEQSVQQEIRKKGVKS